MKIWGVLFAVILVFAGIGFSITSSVSDSQAIIEDLQEAITKNDAKFIQKHLVTDQKNDLTEEEANRILTWFTKNQNDWDAIISKLKEQANQLSTSATEVHTSPVTNHPIANMKKMGKTWIFFDSYKIEVVPVYAYTKANKLVELSSSEPGVVITEDREKNTKDQKAYRIGPLLPGEHSIQASIQTMFGQTKKEILFESQFGKPTSFQVPLDTKKVKIYTNNQDAKLFYQGKPLAVTFQKDMLEYTATLTDVPMIPLEFSVKAPTPFGEMESKTTLTEKETSLDLSIQLGKSSNVRKTLHSLFRDYNNAWVTYAKEKNSFTPVEKYLVPDSKAYKSFEEEVESYLESPPEYQEQFVGKLQSVTIDFGSLTVIDNKTVSVQVKETFQDQWKNVATGDIKNNGVVQLYWTYTLHQVNGEWKIAETIENPSWNWNDKTSDVEEVHLQ